MKGKNQTSIEAMHKLKEQAIQMKEHLLKGDIDAMGELLNFGWEYKKKMTEGISNPFIDKLYETALKAGATGGKISGAGGGGFMFFYCPNCTRFAVEKALSELGVAAKRYEFTSNGLKTWTI